MTDAGATHAVTCFLRSGTDVLLLRRSGEADPYAGRWDGVAGGVESDADGLGASRREFADAARAEIRRTTGLDECVTLVRGGDPISVRDGERTERIVHPFLFECGARAVDPDGETGEYEWAPPTAILDRETVPGLWRSYDAIAPTVEAVREDRDHGAAYLSVRALEVLRDRAAGDASADALDWTALADLAVDLREARPSMIVLRTRIDRAMDAADGDPEAVRGRTEEAIEDALAADDAAAARAASELDGASRVLTLSRSGTVRETIARLDPERVYVAESRPGGEGREVAESLVGGRSATLLTDATVAHALAAEPVDAVLVGADAVLPDGRVVNKVGTRGAALAADREGVRAVVVAARDQVRPPGGGEPDLEFGPGEEVYDGDAPLDVLAPTFDATPAGTVEIVTEAGVLDSNDVEAAAVEARERAGWVEEVGENQ